MAWRTRGRDGDVVLESVCSVLTLVLVVAFVELGDAATAVDVYRLIQYDFAGAPFGSRAADLNHLAGSSLSVSEADLSRTVIIHQVRDLNLTLLNGIITSKQPLGGLLLLLPQRIGSSESEGKTRNDSINNDELTRNILTELEKLFIHAHIPYPVYFTFENDKLLAILADVKRSDVNGQPASATSGGYKLVLPSREPKKVSSPTIINIQGWLPGLKGDSDANQLPTIAIVASYDTFWCCSTRGRYNLLFGLTSGGPYNYNGTLKWLKSFDQRLRESIDYAICLNSIGSWKNELWVHVSKPPENVYIKQVFEGLSDVAREMGVKIGIKHKKINISNPRVAWEHEQFSRVRVTAITLSELSAAPEFLESSGGLYDSRNLVDETAVYKSVKLVAESLARHVYGLHGRNIEIFSENSSLSINPFYVKSWLDLMSRTPRVAPFLQKTDPFISALEKELSDHTVDVHLQLESIDGTFSFYDSTRATLHIYQVASVTFDLLYLLAVGSYLFLLFCFLVATTRGVDDLINIFRRPPSRKAKTA
ncbi:hypothetical protein HPP92_006120 [Vanilla planifolia]|uniref:Nicalin n=1 Tax=Vanilla planifolia TaxID=51239 RepID=A0A835RMZ9_VANPL|nr:hypothetical protein HPP92_006120 [Vanilla planifolia]